MMSHPLRGLFIELAFLNALQAIRELVPGPHCALLSIQLCLRRPPLALVYQIILTDYLVKNVL
jgi:hypothetical protein